jgi:hypothetical protein
MKVHKTNDLKIKVGLNFSKISFPETPEIPRGTYVYPIKNSRIVKVFKLDSFKQ